MKSTRICFMVVAALVGSVVPVQMIWGCTEPSRSAPEIEIEVEFEDYNDIRDRVIYKIEVEAEIMAPTQTAVCQCGISFGSSALLAPESFDVLNAIVGVSKDDGDDFELEAFEGFAEDGSVESSLTRLAGFRDGGSAYGFSTNVDSFRLPPLQPEDAYVLAFLIEFAPNDFAQVDGNQIQFAAGSNEPDHPLNLFTNYQSKLRLPPYQLHECDFNLDQACDASDIDALFALGPIDKGFDRSDRTEIYDLNGDDQISLVDLEEWLEKAADFNGLSDAYVYGDANLDGRFGTADLIQVFQVGQYETGRRGQTWETGDWTGDGLFDSADLVKAFQSDAYEKEAVAIVSEPNADSLPLLFGCWLIQRSRKRPAGRN